MRFSPSQFFAHVSSFAAVASFGLCSQADAVSIQAHGQAAMVGDFVNGLPAGGSVYQGWRLPLGLTLEARPSNNMAVVYDLRLGVNQYPTLAREMGNSQGDKGEPARVPFATQGGRGERFEIPSTGFAYVEYASGDFGLFRVGRMPRHWGLGLWRHDGGVNPSAQSRDWVPEGGSISTTDGVSVLLDFRTLYFGGYWEKHSEGSPFLRGDDAESWTVDLRVGDSLTESSQSSSGREVGIAFSRYVDAVSDTRMNILDLYSRLRYSSLFLEGEFLYPNGSTKSAQYRDLGGGAPCATDAALAKAHLMCEKGSIDWVSTLFRSRYQFSNSGGSDATLSASEATAKRGVPTVSRRETHSAGFWFGYAGGDAGALSGGNGTSGVTMGVMHPNIRPSLLMFSSVATPVAGMPGAVVGNAMFVRGDYTYESPTVGAFTPSLVWGMLRETQTGTTGYGRSPGLGIEADVAYSYLTTDFIKIGADVGVWFPGAAWSEKGSGRPGSVLGGRLAVSTNFQ